MAKTWFRIHAEGPSSLLDNVKIHELPDKLFRWLVLLWACSCRTEGWLPPLKTVAFRLRKQERVVTETVEELVSKRFIERSGEGYFIHDWAEHQFQSDTSTERVRKFRERSGNVSTAVSCSVSGNVTETPRAGTRSESESESEKNPETREENLLVLVQPNGSTQNGWKSQRFDEFWRVVWWKTGKDEARKAFNRKVTSEGMALHVIAVADRDGPRLLREAVEQRRSAIHPATWLNRGCYDDQPPSVAIPSDPGPGVPHASEIDD